MVTRRRIKYMSKRQKQTAFLKALILHGDMDVRAQLQERIKKAERDELCSWRALWLVTVLGLFSCCGICYSAVLMPEFFQNSSHIVVKTFCGLGLASLICSVAFLGFWMWCRAALNHVQEDCRRYVMAMLEPSGRPDLSQPLPTQDRPGTENRATVESRGAENCAAILPTYQTYLQLFSLRRIS